MSHLDSKSIKPFPLVLKLAYTAFVAAHIFFNWRFYGPLNFLWACDVTVLVILTALWTNSRLLTSVAAIAALVSLSLWIVDAGARVVLGHYVFGFAGYMFDRRVPRIIRIISAFHLWLPLMLIWMVARTGYDRRAFVIQSIFMAALLITCRFISEPPPEHSMHEPVNINWVYGTSETGPQTKIPANSYLALMIALYPLLIYWPTHLSLNLILGNHVLARQKTPEELSLKTVTA